ncbi:unnamed protein product [Closterium sp. NIES-53]
MINTGFSTSAVGAASAAFAASGSPRIPRPGTNHVQSTQPTPKRPAGMSAAADDGDAAAAAVLPPVIRRLDEAVVNRIAAGEVIQRPASAVKELVENSLDAGARSVGVVVKDGGLKMMLITDDGHGIRPEDLPILCERHTTSKLRAFEDLESMATLGFRGEALASLTFVSHLTVTTMTAGQTHGFRAQYRDGEMQGLAVACAAVQGTQVLVDDLFFNVPARRKAFRSHSEEYARILDVLSRFAIHNYDVCFSCKKYGEARTDLFTPGAPKQAAGADGKKRRRGKEGGKDVGAENREEGRTGGEGGEAREGERTKGREEAMEKEEEEEKEDEEENEEEAEAERRRRQLEAVRAVYGAAVARDLIPIEARRGRWGEKEGAGKEGGWVGEGEGGRGEGGEGGGIEEGSRGDDVQLWMRGLISSANYSAKKTTMVLFINSTLNPFPSPSLPSLSLPPPLPPFPPSPLHLHSVLSCSLVLSLTYKMSILLMPSCLSVPSAHPTTPPPTPLPPLLPTALPTLPASDRLVECLPLRKACEATYAAILPKAARPFLYLALSLPPHHVDVNVHPTKREVRLSRPLLFTPSCVAQTPSSAVRPFLYALSPCRPTTWTSMCTPPSERGVHGQAELRHQPRVVALLPCPTRPHLSSGPRGVRTLLVPKDHGPVRAPPLPIPPAVTIAPHPFLCNTTHQVGFLNQDQVVAAVQHAVGFLNQDQVVAAVQHVVQQAMLSSNHTRTFYTQSNLLAASTPPVRIPAAAAAADPSSPAAAVASPATKHRPPKHASPASLRPPEHRLVRTDARIPAGRLHAFFSHRPSSQPSSSQPSPSLSQPLLSQQPPLSQPLLAHPSSFQSLHAPSAASPLDSASKRARGVEGGGEEEGCEEGEGQGVGSDGGRAGYTCADSVGTASREAEEGGHGEKHGARERHGDEEADQVGAAQQERIESGAAVAGPCGDVSAAAGGAAPCVQLQARLAGSSEQAAGDSLAATRQAVRKRRSLKGAAAGAGGLRGMGGGVGGEERLTSVEELMEGISARTHSALSALLADCTYVGMVDDRRLLLQHSTSLYLVDALSISKELMWQQAIRRFARFTCMTLHPAPLLADLLLLALEEEERAGRRTQAHGCKQEMVEAWVQAVQGRAEMLSEYFALAISPDGHLLSLPLLLDHHTPDLTRLPSLALALANEVEWDDEKACFASLAAALADFFAFHAPLLPRPSSNQQGKETSDGDRAGIGQVMGGEDGDASRKRKERGSEEAGDEEGAQGGRGADVAASTAVVTVAGGGEVGVSEEGGSEEGMSEAEVEAMWRQWEWSIQHVLLPALKFFLKPPKRMARDGSFIKIASLENLYKIFERC